MNLMSIKGSPKGLLAHIYRIDTSSNPDIDKSLSHENYCLTPPGNRSFENSLMIYERRKKQLYQKNGKKSISAMSCLVTAPRAVRDAQLKRFFKTTYRVLCERFGEGNVFAAVVHMDEGACIDSSTYGRPHMHFLFIPTLPNPRYRSEDDMFETLQNEIRSIRPSSNIRIENELKEVVGQYEIEQIDSRRAAGEIADRLGISRTDARKILLRVYRPRSSQFEEKVSSCFITKKTLYQLRRDIQTALFDAEINVQYCRPKNVHGWDPWRKKAEARVAWKNSRGETWSSS